MVIASEPYDSQADLNSDGIINILDIITLVNIVLDSNTTFYNSCISK